MAASNSGWRFSSLLGLPLRPFWDMEGLMYVVEEKRFEYWNHFITRWALEKVGGGHGVTGPRLRKIRPVIMEDSDFWFNVVLDHGGLNKTPEQMLEFDPPVYNHCLGNFWGMVYETLVVQGILVP